MRWLAMVAVASSCLVLIAAKPKAQREAAGAEEGITDVKALEAKVAAARAELDKARAAAMAEWQGRPEFVTVKNDLDAKKAQLDAVRKAGSEKERTDAEAAFLQAKLSYDKVAGELENGNEGIVAAKKNWEEASKDLADFKRQLSDTSKPLEGVRAIVAALPREYWPTDGKTWTRLQEKAANKWLADNLMGHRLRVNGTADSIDQQRGGKGAIIRLKRISNPMGGERALTADVSALFPESQVGIVRKVTSGKPVAVEGSIRLVHMRWEKDGVDMDVSVGYSTLLSK